MYMYVHACVSACVSVCVNVGCVCKCKCVCVPVCTYDLIVSLLSVAVKVGVTEIQVKLSHCN